LPLPLLPTDFKISFPVEVLCNSFINASFSAYELSFELPSDLNKFNSGFTKNSLSNV